MLCAEITSSNTHLLHRAARRGRFGAKSCLSSSPHQLHTSTATTPKAGSNNSTGHNGKLPRQGNATHDTAASRLRVLQRHRRRRRRHGLLLRARRVVVLLVARPRDAAKQPDEAIRSLHRAPCAGASLQPRPHRLVHLEERPARAASGLDACNTSKGSLRSGVSCSPPTLSPGTLPVTYVQPSLAKFTDNRQCRP